MLKAVIVEKDKPTHEKYIALSEVSTVERLDTYADGKTMTFRMRNAEVFTVRNTEILLNAITNYGGA